MKNFDQDRADTPEEMELALSYAKGELNETQLNFLSFQKNIDIERVKDLAQIIIKYGKIIKILLVFIFVVAFLFSLWLMRG